MTTPTIARLTGPYGARLDRKTYWRLVMPGEKLEWGDEYKHYAARYPKEDWLKSGCGECNEAVLNAGTFLYRRRVSRKERK